jgi:hypothetical protein
VPVDEPEVADVDGNRHLGDPVEGAVEPARRRPLEPRLALADIPHRVDDVLALAPARRELEDDLRRILEVSVEHDHRLTGREIDAAVRAIWCPKLRESRIRRKRGSERAASSISS